MSSYIDQLRFSGGFDKLPALPLGEVQPNEDTVRDLRNWKVKLKGDFLITEAVSQEWQDKGAISYKLKLTGFGDTQYQRTAESFKWIPVAEIGDSKTRGFKNGTFIGDLVINEFKLIPVEDLKGIDAAGAHALIAAIFPQLAGRVVTSSLMWSAYVAKDDTLKGPYFDLGRTYKSKLDTGASQLPAPSEDSIPF